MLNVFFLLVVCEVVAGFSFCHAVFRDRFVPVAPSTGVMVVAVFACGGYFFHCFFFIWIASIGVLRRFLF